MDIRHLKVFVSVFNNRSFSKASEELRLKKPTVSNHIKALESELNCRLFDRMGKINIPTREAGVLYEQSVELIEKIDTLQETIGETTKNLAGKLIIGSSTIPGAYLLPHIMSEFKKGYPETSFQIHISNSTAIIDDVSKHKLIMGIVGAKLVNEQIKYTPFMEDKLIAVSSPFFVNRTKRMTLRELVKLPVVLREEGSGTRKETEKLIAGKEISLNRIRIAGIFGSTEAVKEAVKAGMGVSILSKFSVADELEHGQLTEIELTDIDMKRLFYIATHKKRTLPNLYEKFLEHLVAGTKNQQPAD
jgi:DNA-binding transcriptional LysR family regulator